MFHDGNMDESRVIYGIDYSPGFRDATYLAESIEQVAVLLYAIRQCISWMKTLWGIFIRSHIAAVI